MQRMISFNIDRELTFGSLFKDHPEQLTISAVSCAVIILTQRNRRVAMSRFAIMVFEKYIELSK
jgi:hypothetical protein